MIDFCLIVNIIIGIVFAKIIIELLEAYGRYLQKLKNKNEKTTKDRT